LQRGEAPIASHAIYTQRGVLDVNNPEERKWGMEAGFAWAEAAELRAFYTDIGFSPGMHIGLEKVRKANIPHVLRTLGKDWEKKFNERVSKNQNHLFARSPVGM